MKHTPDSFRTITFKKWDFAKNDIFDQFLPILAIFYEVKITFWKKLEKGGTVTYFQFDIFLIYMLWGIQNQ
jgi:hypothetical protein